MFSAKGYVAIIIRILNDVIIKMAWAGSDFIASRLFAPKYCETKEEIALRIWPSTQISIDKNVVTMPTAANDSVAFTSMFPTIAASVNDKIGSDTPEIKAGIANLLICLKVIVVFKG